MYVKEKNNIISKKINQDMQLIIEEILNCVNSVRSIVLTGGFGRGEGSVIFSGNKCQPINDYDIIVIGRNWKRGIDLTKKRIELAKSCGIRQIDISLIQEKEISKLKFTMSNYDLISSSKIIYGDLDVFRDAPKWDASNMPHKEGIVPLFLFLSSILQSYLYMKNTKKDDLFWSFQQISKSILGWSTAMLIFENLYHPSYEERNKRFQDNFNDEEKLCNLVSVATIFKLNPTQNPYTKEELQEIWHDALVIHLDVMKELLSKYYRDNFSSWDLLITRHHFSLRNLVKKLISLIARKHHYNNCLLIDLSKLCLCLYLKENDETFLKKSKNYFKGLKLDKNLSISLNPNEYIETLLMADINSNLFFDQNNRIFYE